MIPWRNGLALGISLTRQEFKAGEPIVMHIWVDNAGNASSEIFTCSDLDKFKANGFGLFGDDEHKLLSHSESRTQSECKVDPGHVRIVQAPCKRDMVLEIPAHTCVNGDGYDYTTILTESYDLPVGEYTIRPLQQLSGVAEDMCKPDYESPPPMPSGASLSFTVTQS